LIFYYFVTISSNTLASFNRRRRMKAKSRQIPQKLAVRLKFVDFKQVIICVEYMHMLICVILSCPNV